MRKIKVFILSAYPVFTEGIKAFLITKNFITISGYSKNFESTKEFLNNNLVDILLINDLSFDNTRLTTYISSLLKSFPLIKIIVLTNSRDSKYFKRLVLCNVISILHDSVAKTTITGAIKLAAKGQVYFSDRIRFELNKNYIKACFESLTKREEEILKLFYNGMTNQEIADAEFRSVKTIENHIENIKKKCGVKHVKELKELKPK